jgi:hypothetical protein
VGVLAMLHALKGWIGEHAIASEELWIWSCRATAGSANAVASQVTVSRKIKVENMEKQSLP